MRRAVPLVLAGLLGHAALASPAPPSDIDTRNGLPAAQAGKLPKTGERYRVLQQQIERARPAVESAKQKSEALSTETAGLRRQLISTAARVQALEQNKVHIDLQVAHLSKQEKDMSSSLSRDRERVARLLAILERLQTDLPPAVAFEPADALKASRGAMVLGAWLPRIYGAAAALSRQLKGLRQTYAALLLQRQQGAANAEKLSEARAQLNKLLASKEYEASGASAAWQALQTRFDTFAAEAADLKALLDRVSALRARARSETMVVVSAGGGAAQGNLKPGSLAKPVVGQALAGSLAGDIRMPGLDFLTAPGASVVAPADSQVLFAGPYHKSGQVLILEAAGGYDLVLVGLDRIDVRSGDRLLAGEPVGTMPARNGAKLYFELRRNGKGISPLPWLGLDLRKKKS